MRLQRARAALFKVRASEERDAALRRRIRSIPRGKVATYSQVAASAGYPMHQRQVVRVLKVFGQQLPWHRVLGAGGSIRLRGAPALEQRTLLEMEGVSFRGKRVDMAKHQVVFKPWED
ncbi:MAG TPA: cysteine methyltransferase [Solibacterales bacterium]|nr:cysteine methyltransferase [Bryobacterales bacterium]